jgi:3'-5' exoribonuclease
MMPEHGDPVSGFFRLALTTHRAHKPVSDLALATFVQSFPAAIRTNIAPRGLDGQAVFVEGTIACINGARFILLKKVRSAVPEDHVARLYLTRPEWVPNKDSMIAFVEIYEELAAPYQRLVDEIFRDDEVLQRFVSAPASMNGHHSYPGGLLDHAVDTAQIVARELATGRTSCDPDTAVIAAVLHDLGKTLEYETNTLSNGVKHVGLTTRGILVGHKLTGMDLLTQAAARLRDLAASSAGGPVPVLTDDQMAALVHAVTASHAPEHTGLRSPITPEANLVAAADRMSADSHLYATLAPVALTAEPWGRAHWHIGRKRTRPYFVRQLSGEAA